MGVKLTKSMEFDEYRKSLKDIGRIFALRVFRPWLNLKFLARKWGCEEELQNSLYTAHSFTRNVIDERKKLFEENIVEQSSRNPDEEENM